MEPATTIWRWLSVIAHGAVLTVVLACSVESIAGPTYQAGAEPNDLRWDLAQRFNFVVDSGGVSFSVVTPVGCDLTRGEIVPSIRVSVRFDMPDVNDLMAVAVDSPVVFSVIDACGAPVAWQGAEPSHVRRYARVSIQGIQEAYTFLRQMMPPGFSLELPLGTSQVVPPAVVSIEGYIWALYADRTIEVDIPFEPNGWVESEQHPGLMISVDPTTPPRPDSPIEYESLPTSQPGTSIRRPTAPIQMYKYTTWVKSKTGTPVMGLADSWYSPSVRASVEYVVIKTQLFDSEAQVASTSLGQSVISDAGRGANCVGTLSQCEYVFDRIRHVLAVHPVEVKIPFVLTNIPVTAVFSVD
ncbi:hypothetical protein [Anaerobaca lacustris]|uniref:Uncharacterized protein n=1 Tax=Anaerobaca lacustris TaxID=3044600 RepID=A0AAW6TX55_9BACT|nr:hypothetical protein [Sedimentisphaerales bacterium M17dextr]